MNESFSAEQGKLLVEWGAYPCRKSGIYFMFLWHMPKVEVIQNLSFSFILFSSKGVPLEKFVDGCKVLMDFVNEVYISI